MQVTGFQIKAAIKRVGLRREATARQFKESLFTFEGEDELKPEQVIASYKEADESLARLQDLQETFNSKFTVDAAGKKMSLNLAIKLVGGADRIANFWKDAATTSTKSDRWGQSQHSRDTTHEYAKQQITRKDAMAGADKAAKYAADLRGAIAEGNTNKIELNEKAPGPDHTDLNKWFS